jgi:hypothetical protein
MIMIAPLNLSALECQDWFKHLAKDHGVWVYENENLSKNQNSNFFYQRIPNSKLVVAVEKDLQKYWTIKIAKNGSTVDIRNNAFGYVLNLNNGKCVNSSGYQSDELSPKKGFNYDWKLCETLIQTFGHKLGQSFDGQESVLAIEDRKTKADDFKQRALLSQKKSQDLDVAYQRIFRSSSAKEKVKLEKLLIDLKIKNNYSKSIGGGGALEIPSVYQHCRGQTRFIEQTLKDSKTTDFAPVERSGH